MGGESVKGPRLCGVALWHGVALEDPAYRRLTKDPTDAIERKTNQLLKNLHSLKIPANKYDRPAPDHQDCTDFRRFISKGSP